MLLPKSSAKLIKQAFKRVEGRIPDSPVPSKVPEFERMENDSSFGFIWLGHSTVYLNTGGTRIMTDPVFSKRASPVSFTGPRSFLMQNPFQAKDIPVPDIILYSHDHFDHLDHKAVKHYFREVKLFLVPLGMREHLERWGVPPENIKEFDWWQEDSIFGDLKITAAPSQHFSGRRGRGNATLWCSWIIEKGSKKIFFSGDSGYGEHFQEIGERKGPFDITLMESGAYGKYWPYIHMLPEQSVQAAVDADSKLVLPIHWARFNLAFHPWKEPVERFTREASRKGLPFTTPLIGEYVSLSGQVPVSKWWDNGSD